MSGLIALDHHVVPTETRSKAAEKPAGEWSARRRLAVLVACATAAWAIMLTPVFVLL